MEEMHTINRRTATLQKRRDMESGIERTKAVLQNLRFQNAMASQRGIASTDQLHISAL